MVSAANEKIGSQNLIILEKHVATEPELGDIGNLYSSKDESCLIY